MKIRERLLLGKKNITKKLSTLDSKIKEKWLSIFSKNTEETASEATSSFLSSVFKNLSEMGEIENENSPKTFEERESVINKSRQSREIKDEDLY